MATTLLKDLVGRVKRSTMMLDGYTDEQVTYLVMDAIEELESKGISFTIVGSTIDDVGFTNPPGDPSIRSIIALQTKVIALKANPLKSLKITGLEQQFNTEQAIAAENELDRKVVDFLMEANPVWFTMNEYDVLAEPGIHIRTLKSLIFPRVPYVQ